MISQSTPIHIYKNEQYPNGYTISNSKKESQELARELLDRTICKGVSVTHGDRHWKTGKYAYWIVFFDEPYEVKQEYIATTHFA